MTKKEANWHGWVGIVLAGHNEQERYLDCAIRAENNNNPTASKWLELALRATRYNDYLTWVAAQNEVDLNK